jgi:peptidoglycan/LPS O-acetylase OafA/YrhL
MKYVVDGEFPPSENKLFYPALDGLRAIAVLMVFSQHYIGANSPALSWGWTGVDFFFVLSGFLITGILYDTRLIRHRVRNFYGRRTLRIFPLYYAVLLVGLLLTPIFHWAWHPAWYLWPVYLGNYARFLYLPDFLKYPGTLEHLRSTVYTHPPFFLYFGHFWSLCVEEQFYLLWPMVVFFVKDRVRLRNICLATCVICLILRIFCIFTVPAVYLNAELLYRLTPLRADALLLGGFIALALRGPEAAWVKRAARPIFYLGLVGFIAFEVLYRLITHRVYAPIPNTPILSTLGFTLIDLFAASLILLSLDSNERLYRLFTLKPLRSLGRVSYGFYVFHDIPHLAYAALIFRLLPRIHHPSIYIAAVALTGTLILSYLSFHFFETPFLSLKRFFI